MRLRVFLKPFLALGMQLKVPDKTEGPSSQAARWLQGDCMRWTAAGRRILASTEIRKQAATGCRTKMKTVRSRSVSARAEYALQGRPLSARPDFGPDFGPYFWVLPSNSFFPAEGLQACERFPHIGFQG